MSVESRKGASKNQSGVRPLIKASPDVSVCTFWKVDISMLLIHAESFMYPFYSGKSCTFASTKQCPSPHHLVEMECKNCIFHRV